MNVTDTVEQSADHIIAKCLTSFESICCYARYHFGDPLRKKWQRGH